MHPRSYLFVPGDRPERFDKALGSPADAVVLDLEDAVPPAAKEQARERAAEWIERLPVTEKARVVVRINDSATPWFAADTAMLRATGVSAAMLPKAESVQQVALLRERTSDDLAVLALVETARGVLDVAALAAAPGVVRLVFGTIDYALDMDLVDADAGLDHAAGMIAIASRACGLASPVAGVTPDIDDAARVRADLSRYCAQGFGAKLCIHPRQVNPVHEMLRPTLAQLAWAERVVAAAQVAEGAAVQVDGRMVDKPVLEQARRVIARGGATAI